MPKRKQGSHPPQPNTNDQSGSAGRRAPDGDTPKGKDTGQDRYGQSGFSGPAPEKQTGK